MNKVLIVVSIVMAWLTKAMADGKLTASELVDLAEQVASILGVPLEIDLPGVHPTEERRPEEKRRPEAY